MTNYIFTFLIFEPVVKGGNIIDRLVVKTDDINCHANLVSYLEQALSVAGRRAILDMFAIDGVIVYLNHNVLSSNIDSLKLQNIFLQLSNDLNKHETLECKNIEIINIQDVILEEVYENPPTVSVLLFETVNGLVVIKRGLKDGYGKWALPGGYQVKGETWQQAAVREISEEVGVDLDPNKIKLLELVTVENGAVNLAFGQYTDVLAEFVPKFDSEVLDVNYIDGPIETAFSAHTKVIFDFYNSKKG